MSSLTKGIQSTLPFASSSAPASFELHGLFVHFLPFLTSFQFSQHGPISPFSFHTRFCLNIGFVFSSIFPILTHTDEGSTAPAVCSTKLLNMHFSATASPRRSKEILESW